MARLIWAAGMAAALGAVLTSACSGGDSRETRTGVLSDSLKAASQLRSYEVQVEGEVRQGQNQARVKLTYEFVAPDKLRWLNETTTASGTERAGLLVVGSQWWSLDGGTWTQERPLATDIRTLSADRIWRIVPFTSAKTTGKVEDVNGFKATRFSADESAKISFEFLAGSLVVGDDPGFDGELTEFKVDYWTQEGTGYPVQLKMVATGSDRKLTLSARLTKADDASIQVGAPAVFLPLQPPPAAVAAAAPTASAPPANTAAQPPSTPAAAPQPAAAVAPTQPAIAPPAAAAPANAAAPQSAAPQPAAAAPAPAVPQPSAPQPPNTQQAASPELVAVQAGAPLPSSGTGGLVRGSYNWSLLLAGLALALAGLGGVLECLPERAHVPAPRVRPPQPRAWTALPRWRAGGMLSTSYKSVLLLSGVAMALAGLAVAVAGRLPGQANRPTKRRAPRTLEELIDYRLASFVETVQDLLDQDPTKA